MLATQYPVRLRDPAEQVGNQQNHPGHCPVCESANHSVFIEGAHARLSAETFGSSRTDFVTGTILRCADCGFGFAQHRPTDDELGRLYREMDIAVYQSENVGRRRTAQRHLSIVTRHLSGGRLLDVGCASGVFLDRAQSAGWDVVGIEPSPLLYQVARDLLAGRGEVLPLTLQEADIAPRQFDAITLWDVLEHVTDPVAFLTRCRSLLNPGGFVFANVPDLDSLPARLLGRRWPLLLPEHLNYFNRPSLADCIERAGLEVIRFGRRPSSFSGTYILHRVGQHGIPGAGVLHQVAAATGLGKLVLPLPMGETFVVCC